MLLFDYFPPAHSEVLYPERAKNKSRSAPANYPSRINYQCSRVAKENSVSWGHELLGEMSVPKSSLCSVSVSMESVTGVYSSFSVKKANAHQINQHSFRVEKIFIKWLMNAVCWCKIVMRPWFWSFSMYWSV